jgi:hypothetical protein
MRSGDVNYYIRIAVIWEKDFFAPLPFHIYLMTIEHTRNIGIEILARGR